MPCNNTCLMGDICGDRYGGSRKPPCASQPEELSTTALDLGSPKFPTIQELRKSIVDAGVCSEFGLDMNLFGKGVAVAHDFICRQLRASA